jgi:hypothetical protein
VQAEWDRDLPPYMAQTLFPLLVNAPERYVMLAEGTHTICMEKNRLQLFATVQAFLDEAGRTWRFRPETSCDASSSPAMGRDTAPALACGKPRAYFFIFLVFLATFLVALAVFAFFAFFAMSSSWGSLA